MIYELCFEIQPVLLYLKFKIKINKKKMQNFWKCQKYSELITIEIITNQFAVCWPRWIFVGEQYSWWLARNTFGSFDWIEPSSISEWFVGLFDWISTRLRSHHNKTWTLTITIRLCQSRHDKSSVTGGIKWVHSCTFPSHYFQPAQKSQNNIRWT